MTLERAARAFERRDFAAGHDIDIGQALDPLDEILRHGRGQRAAGDQSYTGGAAGEENGGLAGGIAAADQRDLVPRGKVASSGEAQ